MHQKRGSAALPPGVNDGAALAEADVGVVIGSIAGLPAQLGTVVFSGDDLSDFAKMLPIARHATMTATANLIFLVVAASLGMGLALSGLLNPTWAAGVRFTSELAVIINAARLISSTR